MSALPCGFRSHASWWTDGGTCDFCADVARDARIREEERKEARSQALTEAAALVRKYLAHNSQRAVSWHEVQDAVEAILALKGGAP